MVHSRVSAALAASSSYAGPSIELRCPLVFGSDNILIYMSCFSLFLPICDTVFVSFGLVLVQLVWIL